MVAVLCVCLCLCGGELSKQALEQREVGEDDARGGELGVVADGGA